MCASPYLALIQGVVSCNLPTSYMLSLEKATHGFCLFKWCVCVCLLCMSVLSACVSVYHVHNLVPVEPEEGICILWDWESNLGSLEEHQCF